MGENILSVSIGVLARPVTTLRWICQQRPVVWAIIITVFMSLIGAIAQGAELNSRPLGLFSDMPDEVAAQFSSLLPGLTMFFIIAAPLFALLGLVIGAAVYHLVAYLLGGRSTYGGMFSAIAFAELPTIFNVPLATLPMLLGGAGAFLGGLAGFGLWAWSIVLLVIAIRENYQFSTGRAVVTFLIPVFVAMGLALLVAIIAVLLVASSLAPR